MQHTMKEGRMCPILGSMRTIGVAGNGGSGGRKGRMDQSWEVIWRIGMLVGCVYKPTYTRGWRKRRIELSPISALHAYGDDIDDDGDFDPLQHWNSTCVSLFTAILGKNLFIFVWQKYIECFVCGTLFWDDLDGGMMRIIKTALKPIGRWGWSNDAPGLLWPSLEVNYMCSLLICKEVIVVVDLMTMYHHITLHEEHRKWHLKGFVNLEERWQKCLEFLP